MPRSSSGDVRNLASMPHSGPAAGSESSHTTLPSLSAVRVSSEHDADAEAEQCGSRQLTLYFPSHAPVGCQPPIGAAADIDDWHRLGPCNDANPASDERVPSRLAY
jgi:hypothetical protein